MKTQSAIKRALLACAACGIVSAAPLVQAGTLGTLATTGYIGEAVTIDYNNVNQGTSAIAFTGATFNGNPIDPFWCIDLSKHVPYPGWSIPGYTADTFKSPPLGFNTTQVQDLRTLFQLHLPSTLTAQNAAAFQLAIWDLLFDDDHLLNTYGLGGFGVVTGNAGTLLLAQGLIDDALAKSGSSSFLLVQLTSEKNQNFITPGTLLRVPEPAGIALFGIGLLAMVLLGRRRATATRK